MNLLKLVTRSVGAFAFISFILLSCKKEPGLTPTSANGNTVYSADCAENSGYFNINLDGQHHNLVLDSTTQYTNLYNWFGEDESHFVVIGSNQNSNPIYIEMALPGKFKLGTTTYSIDSLDQDFFDLSIDTFSLYVSKVTFNVSVRDLNLIYGMFRPVKASFTGVAHHYPWYNNQAPADTVIISGDFCLNGFMLP